MPTPADPASGGAPRLRGRKIDKFRKMTLCYSCFFGRKATKSTVFLEFSIKYSIFAMFSRFLGTEGALGGRGRHLSGGAPLNYVTPLPGCSPANRNHGNHAKRAHARAPSSTIFYLHVYIHIYGINIAAPRAHS